MASSIRLADAGLPEVPPPGSARVFIEEYGGRLHLKMLRPDGTIEVFGTLNLPLEVENGGTGTTQLPQVGQILIGDGSRYKPGNIVAGRKINIVSTENDIEINAEVQDFFVSLSAPPEFTVDRTDFLGSTTLTLNKVIQQAHKIYAGPINGANAEPTFRLLVQEDIPDLNSEKILGLSSKIAQSVPESFEDSQELEFNYSETTKKISFSLKNSGVLAGTYGNGLEIPIITVNSKGIIESASTTSIKEAVEDVVGGLIVSTDSIHAEYDDLNSQILLSIKEESVITTNISETEVFKAPTSQAIKQYVDDVVSFERQSRISSDSAIQENISSLEQQLLDERIFSRYDNYVITATDIQNGFLSLSSKNVLLQSITALVDRTPLLQDIDFTVSEDLQKNVTLTFIGDLLQNQPLALEIGDNVRVNYLFRN